MRNTSRCMGAIMVLSLVIASVLFAAPAGATTTSYYAWDKDGHTYVSNQSQAIANAAAAAWNKKNTYSARWSGFVVYGTCPPSNPPNRACPDATSAARQIIDIKGEAASGTFWLATSNSGAVFTSVISQSDADAKAAADLNPAPSPAYTATSAVGVTYTSSISQADANLMATFVEHTAMPVYIAPGPNGLVFQSTVSTADAEAQVMTFQSENLYQAAAGDYMGFDQSLTNPADLVMFDGPTQAAVDSTATAWGTALVRGGVYIASDRLGRWIYVSGSQAGAAALAMSLPESSTFTPAYTAMSQTGQVFANDGDQQWAYNAAAYTYQKPRVLPTSPETCYQGSKSNTLTLLSWQCPAHWTLLTPAKTSAAALKAAAAAVARLRTLTCDSPLGNVTVTSDAPKCAAGFHAVPNTIVCVKGTISRKVTGIAAKCPAGYRPKTS